MIFEEYFSCYVNASFIRMPCFFTDDNLITNFCSFNISNLINWSRLSWLKIKVKILNASYNPHTTLVVTTSVTTLIQRWLLQRQLQRSYNAGCYNVSYNASFYMITVSVMKELNKNLNRIIFMQSVLLHNEADWGYFCNPC